VSSVCRSCSRANIVPGRKALALRVSHTDKQSIFAVSRGEEVLNRMGFATDSSVRLAQIGFIWEVVPLLVRFTDVSRTFVELLAIWIPLINLNKEKRRTGEEIIWDSAGVPKR